MKQGCNWETVGTKEKLWFKIFLFLFITNFLFPKKGKNIQASISNFETFVWVSFISLLCVAEPFGPNHLSSFTSRFGKAYLELSISTGSATICLSFHMLGGAGPQHTQSGTTLLLHLLSLFLHYTMLVKLSGLGIV